MKRVTFGLLVLAVASAACAETYLLPPEVGEKALRQCSRPAPWYAERLWTPTPEQISELERGLDSYVRSRPAGKYIAPLAQFDRQYIGFTNNGKNFIYGNFFRSSETRQPKDLASVPVNVCDGGFDFWGVVYAVESKTLQDLYP